MNYFTPAKTGESVGIVCVNPIMIMNTTQQKACQDNGINNWIKKRMIGKRVEYPRHPVRHLQY